MADQRSCCPLPGVVANREAVGRPLPCWRADAGPVVTAEVFAEQDEQEDGKTVREPTNAPEGRAYSTRSPTRHRPGHGPPHPHDRAHESTFLRRPCHRRANPPIRTRPPWLTRARGRQEAWEHPRRWGLAIRRATSRIEESCRHSRQAEEQVAHPKLGYAFVHTIIDDHSRVAYTEVQNDESAVTAVGVLHRAVEWFADRGVAIERILSDNGGAYRSHLWRDTCEALSITPKRTRPYRPQTNGKVERFHRTMADGWAYARCYTSENERRDALPDWLHEYNQHRPHTACGGQPPFSRLINVPGQYI